MVELRTNNNVAYQCAYHLVWCTKYRRDIIQDDIETRLKQIIREVCAEHDAPILELETMPDHVHLAVTVDPQYGIHRLAKAIKGRSSRVLRQEFPTARTRVPTLWTNSYYVATTGGAPLETIKQYIRNQKNV